MRRSLIAFVLGICILTLPRSTDARQLRTTLAALAQDYVIIQDQRSPHEVVMVFWITPQLVGKQPSAEKAKQILTDHALVGVVHAKFDTQGRTNFEKANAPSLKTLAGRQIKQLTSESISPAAQGVVTVSNRFLPRRSGPWAKEPNGMFMMGSRFPAVGMAGFLSNSPALNTTIRPLFRGARKPNRRQEPLQRTDHCLIERVHHYSPPSAAIIAAAALANSSTRSFSACPEWPFTHRQSTV